MNKQIIIYLSCVSFFFIVSSPIMAQKLTTKKVTDIGMTRMVNSIKTFKQFSEKDLGITLLEVTNSEGSAKEPETETVTSNLYFGVTEPDLAPKQVLYLVKNIYGPSNFTLEKSEVGVVWISFDYFDQTNNPAIKKKATIKLTLTVATIVQ